MNLGSYLNPALNSANHIEQGKSSLSLCFKALKLKVPALSSMQSYSRKTPSLFNPGEPHSWKD